MNLLCHSPLPPLQAGSSDQEASSRLYQGGGAILSLLKRASMTSNQDERYTGHQTFKVTRSVCTERGLGWQSFGTEDDRRLVKLLLSCVFDRSKSATVTDEHRPSLCFLPSRRVAHRTFRQRLSSRTDSSPMVEIGRALDVLEDLSSIK